MFTIETERDGLKEQTLKKYVLQGKIRLTVNIKHNNKKKCRGGRRKGKVRHFYSRTDLQKKKKYNKVCGEFYIQNLYTIDQ